MATTTFVDGETLIEAAWLNDVNAVVYTPGTQTAADIANVPAGSITATDVQAALNELDTEKVADSDFTGTNQSLAMGGYQKFPGGLIIQWGTAQETGGANVLQTISLPVNYTTAHLAAYASSVSTGTFAGATTNGGSLSSLQAFASNNTGTYYWLSIGY